MVLQLIFDDKFGDYAIEQFARFGNDVHFVFLCDSAKNTPKFVKRLDAVSIIAYATPEYKVLLQSLDKYKAVITHGLFSHMQYDIIRHLPANVKLAWVLWGAEIYARSDRYVSHLSKTSKVFYYLHLLSKAIKGKKSKNTDVPFDVLQRVDYLLDDSSEFYNDVCVFLNKPSLKFLTYSYYTLEDLIGEDLLTERINGHNILLNNSSCVEGNHLNAMFKLWRYGVPSGSKVIIPLSYGDIWFGRVIDRIAKILFKDQYTPLYDFMPRQEYNKIVVGCSSFISNHYRPNAFGNILTALWLGARIYMSKQNLQAKFLQRLGLSINFIEDKFNRDSYSLSSLDETNRNRAIIRAYYGKSAMEKNVESIILELNK